jgi:hypothetical protein
MTTYIKPEDMIIGGKYRCVDVESHPFAIEQYAVEPFTFMGVDPSDDTFGCQFSDGTKQWFGRVYTALSGGFKIVDASSVASPKIQPTTVSAIKMEKQFEIGDKVLVLRMPRVAEGYQDRHQCLTPKVSTFGRQGIVTEVDYSYATQYPDVLVAFDDGSLDYIDINYVKLIGKPLKALTPQCLDLLAHMNKGHSVTQRSALIDFGIAALPRRIADLKVHGYRISSKIERNTKTNRNYARYTLITTEKAIAA